MHSFQRKLSALSNAASCKVVQQIGRELFDLKARGDIFLITLYKVGITMQVITILTNTFVPGAQKMLFDNITISVYARKQQHALVIFRMFYYCAIGIYVTGNVWNQAFYECLDKNSQAFCRMPEYLRYSYTETILITHEGHFQVHACH